MALPLARADGCRRGDWWWWRVWLDGPARELDQVESVTYKLHQAFPEPIRTITNRSTKFELRSGGWGTFTIYATVTRKDGTSKKLRHALHLEYPSTELETASHEKRDLPTRIFLSYEAEDAGRASELKATLRSLEIEVVDADSLDAGLPPDVAVARALETSDAYMMVSGSAEPGVFLRKEMRAAERAKKPVVVVGELPLHLKLAAATTYVAASDAERELPVVLRGLKWGRPNDHEL